jgi:phosphate-selective porin OprO/OprP
MDGVHYVGPYRKLTFKIGGRALLDGGYISANRELKEAFPSLDGAEGIFRRLSVDASGTLGNVLQAKIDIDFANVRDIKDIWIRFPFSPALNRFRFGHLREPMSLENQTSINNITFMEGALSAESLSPGRNLGVRYDRPAPDYQGTLSLGAFFNTGSFSNVGDAKDRISEANGFDLTGRVTKLLRYEGQGERLLHVGASLLYGARDVASRGADVRFASRPESRITDERLIDTGTLSADRVTTVQGEAAMVDGPLSFQGEYFHTFVATEDQGSPNFWGFYTYASYFLTGEHRVYNQTTGAFDRIYPNRDFRFRKEGWGAWETGLRISYADLSSKDVEGGKELNVTAGLNWYLNRNGRFMFNYIFAYVRDREDPSVDGGVANLLQVRFQVAF